VRFHFAIKGTGPSIVGRLRKGKENVLVKLSRKICTLAKVGNERVRKLWRL